MTDPVPAAAKLTEAELTAIYRRLIELTVRMRDEARADAWDELEAIDAARAGLWASLMQSGVSANPGGERRALAAELLELEREIKTLVESRMGEIKGLLRAASVQKKVDRAYDPEHE